MERKKNKEIQNLFLRGLREKGEYNGEEKRTLKWE